MDTNATQRLKVKMADEAAKEGFKANDIMTRPTVPTADAIIGQRFPVLDKGFLALVDYMGNDNAIVQAARVSYGMGTKKVTEDRGLLRYLMRHRHSTPFEMVEIKFIAKLPIMVERQWVRHRTASINGISARYSIMPDDYYIPEAAVVQAQSKTNRQGRGDALPPKDVDHYRKTLGEECIRSYELYAQYLENGVAREIARMVLNQNFYTEWYWKANLHNIFHFLSLRLDSHAQYEIRMYAHAMANIVKAVAPTAHEAFEDFTMGSVSLSKREKHAVGLLLRGSTVDEACKKTGIQLRKADGSEMKSGEGVEFLHKLDEMKQAADAAMA